MAYDRQSIKLTWGFLINGTDEIAVTGLHYSSGPGSTDAAVALANIEGTSGWAGDLRGLLADLMGTSDLRWANYSSLRSVRVAALDVTGHEIGDAIEWEETPAPQGASSTTIAQSTVVLSLRSGLTTGSGNYGRMYLPHTSMTLNSGSPYALPASVGVLATAAKTFINGVTEVLDDPGSGSLRPTIMSAKAGAVSKEITQVGFGSVTDTQRRRRNRLIESYALEAL